VPEGDDPDSGRPLHELLADTRSKTPDAGAAEADDLRRVTGLLLQLDERSAAVLRLRFGLDGEGAKTLKEIGERLGLTLRFGLDGEGAKTLKEIGERLGLTRERVRQIEGEALGRLRAGLGGVSLLAPADCA
jgi:RNA polymerase primary sigma factor